MIWQIQKILWPLSMKFHMCVLRRTENIETVIDFMLGMVKHVCNHSGYFGCNSIKSIKYSTLLSCKRYLMQIPLKKVQRRYIRWSRSPRNWANSSNPTSCEMVFQRTTNDGMVEGVYHLVAKRHVVEVLRVTKIQIFQHIEVNYMSS